MDVNGFIVVTIFAIYTKKDSWCKSETNVSIIKNKIKQKSHIPLHKRRIKYLGINLTMKGKDPCIVKTVMLMKELKDTQINRKIILCHKNIVTMPMLPPKSTDSIQSLLKFQWHFLQN